MSGSAPLPASHLLAVAVGGAVGALLRWALTLAWPAAPGALPWVVVVVNVVGSGLLAALPALAVVRRRDWAAPLLGTGVLGGFTTMSAASVDTVVLLDAGRPVAGAAYVLGTLVGALLAVLLVSRAVRGAAR
ncbi:CrcB family protein [Marmoricola sp. Leaf446]|uniref:FluC/FEX family fluoride channel n=1 Tax=Marmoricola sp. Leaf446 TaxID=1736379 RepID=UPI00190FD121|nr:CrcB family protein [Marmoricola sp. Leaf446]